MILCFHSRRHLSSRVWAEQQQPQQPRMREWRKARFVLLVPTLPTLYIPPAFVGSSTPSSFPLGLTLTSWTPITFILGYFLVLSRLVFCSLLVISFRLWALHIFTSLTHHCLSPITHCSLICASSLTIAAGVSCNQAVVPSHIFTDVIKTQ